MFGILEGPSQVTRASIADRGLIDGERRITLMTQTIRQLIDEQATWLVGRDDEMDVLRRLLGEDGPLVVFVHGIAGIGKSALVEAFGVEARAAGATVLRLDCRSIEPTERGFLAALEAKTGGELTTAEAAATRLDGLGERVVLVLDTYELARLLDPWLRQIVRAGPVGQDPGRPVGSGAADDRLAELPGRALSGAFARESPSR